MSLINKKYTSSLLIIFCTLSFQTGVAAETLMGFKEANLYSVKIKTRIKYPFFEDSRRSRSGAGFLVDRERGWVVTNAHVTTRNPESTSVKFKGHKRFDAELFYVDPYLDLAIIKIPKSKIPEKNTEAKLECNFNPSVGHPVGAFGHPFSLSFTGTRGIISGFYLKKGERKIQTDAAINNGNSGGPLIDLRSGSVIGINTSGYSKKKAEGIGFAIPINFACRILNLLRDGFDPSPAKLHIELAPDPDEDTGLNVVKVYNDDWPLRSGDKIIRGRDTEESAKFETLSDFIHFMRTSSAAKDVTIERNGKEENVSLQIKRVPKILNRKGLYISGMNLGRLKERDYSVERYGENLIVYDVKSSSEASSSGIENFDRIISVDGKSILSIDELEKYCRSKKKNNKEAKVRFLVYRKKGSYRTNALYRLIDLKLEKIKLIQYRKL